jgi:hypothetical protein
LPRRYVTGNASFGVNQRKAASGIATPRTTAQTMSEGWSTARYRRAMATTAITTPVASFAQSRGRPGTTIAYVNPMRQAARVRIGNEGAANPVQSPMIVTPYGRGRRRSR